MKHADSPAAGANAAVISSFGTNQKADPNAQLKIGGVGMTSVQGTGQTGIRTSGFKKGVLGNAKNAQSFPRNGMTPVILIFSLVTRDFSPELTMYDIRTHTCTPFFFGVLVVHTRKFWYAR